MALNFIWVGFFIVAIAANQISKVFQKIKFPLIAGLIITGIIAGSSVLNFIPPDALDKLNFLNEIACCRCLSHNKKVPSNNGKHLLADSR